jgi:hypothetical protein
MWKADTRERLTASVQTVVSIRMIFSHIARYELYCIVLYKRERVCNKFSDSNTTFCRRKFLMNNLNDSLPGVSAKKAVFFSAISRAEETQTY